MQIYSGILQENDRLPPFVISKKKYKLSTSSVQSGFEYLMIKGLIRSHPRSGYFVTGIQGGEYSGNKDSTSGSGEG